MSDSKHSKLSAKAADYVPSSMAAEFSNPMVAAAYARSLALGSFQPSAMPLHPHTIPSSFLVHSGSVPPPFQSPYLYGVRPSFIDGLSMPAMQSYQMNHQEFITAEYNATRHVNRSNSFRNRPKSTQTQTVPPPPQQQSAATETKEDQAKTKKKKKKSKRKSDAAVINVTETMNEVSLEDRSVNATFAVKSYSDALKRPPVASKAVAADPVKTLNEPEKSPSSPTSPVEEYPSLGNSRHKGFVAPKLVPSDTKGVLRVSPADIQNFSDSRSRHAASFKLNLANLAAALPNNKKPKNNSSAQPIRSVTPDQPSIKRSDSGTHKKSVSSVPDGSSSATGDSPERKPKYSKLKKVILEERKKRQQHNTDVDDGDVHSSVAIPDTGNNNGHDIDDATESTEPSSKTVEVLSPAPVTKTTSSSTPPSKSSNALGNACNASLSSALVGLSKEDGDAVCRRLHRRRFREYCNQVLGAALDDATYLLLTTLGGFQQRQYEQNPMKAKLRRRYVCGLREAVKHIQLNKAKCIVLAPNIERIPGKGGLDDIIISIISQCASKNIPVIYALGRVALGRACSKPSPVSSVAIVSPAGAEDKFKQMIELAQRAHESYVELVKMAVAEQIEQREQSSKNASLFDKATTGHSGSGGHHHPTHPSHHMGHHRNASNISAISFISNVSAMSDSNNLSGSNNNGPINDGDQTLTNNGDDDGDGLEDVEDDFEDEEDGENDDDDGEELEVTHQQGTSKATNKDSV